MRRINQEKATPSKFEFRAKLREVIIVGPRDSRGCATRLSANQAPGCLDSEGPHRSLESPRLPYSLIV